MTRFFLASILGVYTLTVVLGAVGAQQPTPKKSELPKPNQVSVKVIWPTDPSREKNRPVVESWIAEQLKKREQAKFAAATEWVSFREGVIGRSVWDGTLDGKRLACPVQAEIVERAEGRIKVRFLGWRPGAVEVTVSLLDEPGSREIATVEQAKTESGLPYVAVLIGPPLIEPEASPDLKK